MEASLREEKLSEIIFGDSHVSLVCLGGEVYLAAQCLGLAIGRVVWEFSGVIHVWVIEESGAVNAVTQRWEARASRISEQPAT